MKTSFYVNTSYSKCKWMTLILNSSTQFTKWNSSSNVFHSARKLLNQEKNCWEYFSVMKSCNIIKVSQSQSQCDTLPNLQDYTMANLLINGLSEDFTSSPHQQSESCKTKYKMLWQQFIIISLYKAGKQHILLLVNI